MNKTIFKIISCFWILFFSEIKAEENAAYAKRLFLEGKRSEAIALLRQLSDAGDKFAYARLLSVEGKYSEAKKIFEWINISCQMLPGASSDSTAHGRHTSTAS